MDCPLQHVRQDGVRKPLQPWTLSYHLSHKHFTIDLNGCNDTVSIDRLKPAHIDPTIENAAHSSTPSDTSTASLITIPTSTRTTRSGRLVHFPHYLLRSVY